jgi:hypothetical protein
MLFGCASSEEQTPMIHNTLCNRRDLILCLPLTQNHLRETLTQFPVMIDLSESKGFYRVCGERFNDLFVRDFPLSEVIKQFVYPLFCH